MRQQLISWLIEDIAPDVRKNGDPAGTIIKFAKEKNLEPALVQSLGQLFNTAKTMAYIEKSANKGGNFPLVDVDKMVDEYLEVRPSTKSAKTINNSRAAYDYLNLDEAHHSGFSLAAAFEGVGELKVEDGDTYKETPIKTASVREMLRTAEDTKRLLADLEFSIADFNQEASELLTKVAKYIKQNEVPFKTVEQDSLGLHGDSVKPALDLLADFCKSAHVRVERADGPGPDRMISEHTSLFDEVQLIQEKLDHAKAAREWYKEAAGEIEAVPKHEKATSKASPRISPGERSMLGGSLPLPAKPVAPKVEGIKSPEDKAQGPGANYFGTLSKGLSNAVTPITNIPEHIGQAKKLLGDGANRDQQTVDNAYGEAEHVATLQELLMNDEVLAQADPDKVVKMYNTLRRLSPSMAKDPNIVRVALRTMIQHDGVSPFDAKSFLDTEQAHQKTDYNKRLLDAASYEGASFKPSPKPM